MLFGYPITTIQDNWFHDCLCSAIRSIHACVDAKKRLPAWPKVLPVSCQARLKSRTGLADRLKAYAVALRRITKAERDVVLAALETENQISSLLSGASECVAIDKLPVEIRAHVVDLFDFAFSLLAPLDVRDRHYAAIDAVSPQRICAFCGTEFFEAPGAPREPLDHYLAKSRYPFAAVNLRNLVPMGHKCNSSYKLAKDLLLRDDGVRRVAFDPYDHSPVTISLDESEPFGGVEPSIPRWNIRLLPETPAVATWDEVFSIRERYQKSHLDGGYRSWLDLLGKVARREGFPFDSDEAVVVALKRFEDLYADSGLQDRAFLKTAVFRMLRLRCEAGDARLLVQVRNLLTPPQASADAVVNS